MPVSGMDNRPLLRGLNRRLTDALTLFLPAHFSTRALEHYIAPAAEAVALDVTVAAAITGTTPETAIFYTAGTGLDPDSLATALNAAAAAAVDIFQPWSDAHVAAAVCAADAESWKTRTRSHANALFSKFSIAAPSADMTLVRILPDTFFTALAALVFGEEFAEKQTDDSLKSFFEFVAALESVAQVEFPDGLPGLDFGETWLFAGGQCAPLRRHAHFTDLFALSPGDMNTLLNELRRAGMYDDFAAACAGCADVAVSALRRVFSVLGIQEFKERLTARAATPAQRAAAADRVLSCAERLFEREKIAPPPSAAARFRASLQARNSPDLFDAATAADDFTALILLMPPRDLQYALIHLPRMLLAQALDISSHTGMMRVLAAVRANASKQFFNALTEDMRRASRAAAEKNDRAAATRARLACFDAIHEMQQRGAISDAIHANDADWLPDQAIRDILNKSGNPGA